MLRYEVGRCLLVERLREAKMSQSQLAKKLGWNRQKISKYVTGETKMMELNTATLIADTIGCSPKDLYEWNLVRDEK